MNPEMLLLLVTLAMGIICGASDPNGCLPPDRVWRHLRRHWRGGHPLLVPTPALEDSQAPKSCPEFILQSPNTDISNRSLSPWRYRIDEDENRIPQKIGVAECLCAGCIIDGKEDSAYNSVPVMQTMVFIRKKECTEPGKYTFDTEMMSIPVACTCVTPMS